MSEVSALEAGVARIARHTLADQVYEDVKELFLSGQIPPGERLTLRRLAAALGTSPMPVRDAVSRLVSAKALEMLPNRSVQVSWPTRGRFEEIVLLRCNLEGLAAELAATRRNAHELKAIEKYAAEFERLAAQDKPDGLKAIRANRLLHFAVYAAARSPILEEMIEGLWLQVGPVLATTVTTALALGEGWRPAPDEQKPVWESLSAKRSPAPGSVSGVVHWHRLLVQAIEAQDAAGARSAIAGDICEAAESIIRSGRLSQAPETGKNRKS